MNLDRVACRSMPPWQPSSEAHDVEVWHRYDHPMAGTFRLQDELVLFTVVGDASDRLSVWAYVPVAEADRAKVDEAEFDSLHEMLKFIESLFAGKEATFALAKGLRVWRWTRHTVPDGDDGLLSAATDAIAEVVRGVTESRRPPSQDVLFQAELAQAAVTTDELVDA